MASNDDVTKTKLISNVLDFFGDTEEAETNERETGDDIDVQSILGKRTLSVSDDTSTPQYSKGKHNYFVTFLYKDLFRVLCIT